MGGARRCRRQEGLGASVKGGPQGWGRREARVAAGGGRRGAASDLKEGKRDLGACIKEEGGWDFGKVGAGWGYRSWDCRLFFRIRSGRFIRWIGLL
jgi:hypothetical protein